MSSKKNQIRQNITNSTAAVLFLVLVTIESTQNRAIDLGFTGNKETQFIGLENIFQGQTIQEQDTFNIKNPNLYPKLLSLDEKSKKCNYTYLKLDTSNIKKTENLQEEFAIEVEKIAADKSSITSQVKFTVLNNLSSFIDVSELKNQSEILSKTVVSGTISEFGASKYLIRGNNISLDLNNSDNRLESRLLDEIKIKFINEPVIPKREKTREAKGYIWKLIHTENYAVRFDDLYNKVWVYECSGIDQKLKEKVCNFKLLMEIDGNRWLIEAMETLDSLILVFKDFSSTLQFKKINLQTMQVESKLIKLSGVNEDFKLYRYGRGWFFSCESQLFDVAITIYASETGELEDFKEMGQIKTCYKEYGYIQSTISSENQKTIMYVWNFSSYPYKIKAQKYDISDLSGLAELKPILESEELDAEKYQFQTSTQTCMMHDRFYYLEIANGFMMGSRGFKSTDRAMEYQLKDFGITSANRSFYIKCLPELNKVLISANVDSKPVWVLINAKPDAQSTDWINWVVYKPPRAKVVAETKVILPTGLHSSVSDNYYVLSQNIDGEEWINYYLRLELPQIYLDLTKDTDSGNLNNVPPKNGVESIKLRFGNEEQYQDLDYRVLKYKKKFIPKIELTQNLIDKNKTKNVNVSLEKYIKFSGQQLRASLISTDSQEKIDDEKIKFIERIQIVDQIEVTQQTAKIDCVAIVEDAFTDQGSKTILGVVSNKINVYSFETGDQGNHKWTQKHNTGDFNFGEILSVSVQRGIKNEAELIVCDYSGSYSDRVTYLKLDTESGKIKDKVVMKAVGGSYSKIFKFKSEGQMVGLLTFNTREQRMYYSTLDVKSKDEKERLMVDDSKNSYHKLIIYLSILQFQQYKELTWMIKKLNMF